MVYGGSCLCLHDSPEAIILEFVLESMTESKLQLDIHLPTEAIIRGYLEKDTDIKNKSLNEFLN
ncbi:hypothetical protein [Andreesenia angusta]|uniref:hypothetical protein n=1 Tax=Andreesenia angusta TaxID=39480 RepID=UPI0008D92319|nr:hypothetical protein [Andreesenia angusta]